MSDLVAVVIVVLAASRLNIVLYSLHHMLIVALSCLISLLCWFNEYIVLRSCSGLPTLLAMECPLCHTVQYKKQWSDGQWKQESPIAHGIIGCKTCRAEEDRRCWAQGGLVERLNSKVLHERRPQVQQFTKHLKIGFECTWWTKLVFDWMQLLDANYRKELSYLGAVRCFDPTHYPPFVACPYLGPTLRSWQRGLCHAP